MLFVRHPRKNCKQPEVVTLGDGRSLVRPENGLLNSSPYGYLESKLLRSFRADALKASSISITLIQNFPFTKLEASFRFATEKFRNSTVYMVKLERAQGGCLGTESRRKT